MELYFCSFKRDGSLLKDKEVVKSTMVRMTSFLEGEDPKYMLSQDDPRMNGLIDYIIGFEIKITSWEGKFKFSQDKHPRDRDLAKKELIKSQQRDVSEFVAQIFENHKRKE